MCLNCNRKNESRFKLKSIKVNKSSELHLKLIEKASQKNTSYMSSSNLSQSHSYGSFVDTDFPPNKKSIYQKRHIFNSLPSFIPTSSGSKCKKPKHWLRPNEIFKIENETSFPCPIRLYENSSSKDVFQGGVGSCWLVAALCVLANRPELLSKTLITKQYNPSGLHQISLCRRGEWVIVNIDDYLPCNREGKIIFSYSKSKDLWVSFIEKALAKLYGSYDAIASGSCVEGLQTLTGEPCEIVYLEKAREKLNSSESLMASKNGSLKAFKSNENPFYLWKKILRAKQLGYLMTTLCYNKNMKFIDLQRTGLLRRHIYSILDLVEFDYNGEVINLVKLSMFILSSMLRNFKIIKIIIFSKK